MECIKVIVTDSSKNTTKPTLYAEGKICIGEFCETFDIPLCLWSLEAYKEQWKSGLERIVSNNDSCLITQIQNTENPLINWWLLYKEGKKIFIRNQFLSGHDYKKIIKTSNLTPKNCYNYIPPRSSKNVDGFEISEWEIDAS